MIRKGFDNYEFATKIKDDFIKELTNSRAELKTFSYGQLAWYNQEQAIKKHGDALAEKLEVEKELVDNNPSELIVYDVGLKKPYLVADTAWLSIKNQIKVFGEGFDEKLSNKTKIYILNEITQKMNEKECTIVFIDQKIRAVMTGGKDGRTFTYVSPLEVLDNFEKVMEEKNAPVEFYSGKYSYTVIRAEYKITNPEITNLYNAFDYEPMVLITTSETGYSSTKLIPIFRRGNTSVILDQEALVFEHKGSNSIDNIKDRIGELFIRQQKFIEKITEYVSLEIPASNGLWRSVFKEVAKRIKTPVKLRKKLEENIEKYIDAYNLKSISFEDIFQNFMDLEVTFKQKEEYEIMLGKIISLDIQKIIKEATEEIPF